MAIAIVDHPTHQYVVQVKYEEIKKMYTKWDFLLIFIYFSRC